MSRKSDSRVSLDPASRSALLSVAAKLRVVAWRDLREEIVCLLVANLVKTLHTVLLEAIEMLKALGMILCLFKR